MEILIIVMPFINFLLIITMGRRIGIKGSILSSWFYMVLTASISVFILFKKISIGSYIVIKLSSWMEIGFVNIPFSFQFDYTSSLIIILISVVSFLIHVYSIEYMNTDPHLPRFLAYLSLFTTFMLILVLGNNLILLFLGWEGVGICSFLLIGFWFTRIQASKAAVKAMIINKIGDLSLICGIIILWFNTGSIEYNQLFSCVNKIQQSQLDISLYLIIVGVIGKSAQIGLHMWLPDAMEGPTPVSALIHAATMVTAGIYLIIKISPLFNQSFSSLLVISFFGSITALISSSISLVQNDLKKVIAYSTCSQLGFMALICGFSFFDVGLFHLINHGFFKALLFLSAGSIIHGLANNQDMRTMGNSLISQPLTFSCFIVGSLALGGLPFLTGFYSKDLIIELIIDCNLMSFAMLMVSLATLFTSIYSTRLLILTFWSKINNKFFTFKNSHEPNINISIVIFTLAILSIAAGFLTKWIIIQEYTPPLITTSNKLMALVLTIVGFVVVCLTFTIRLKLYFTNLYKKIHSMLIYSWYFDFIINHFIVKKILVVSFNHTYKIIDNQIIEYFGPYNLSKSPLLLSTPLSKWANGNILIYVLYLILTLALFLLILN